MKRINRRSRALILSLRPVPPLAALLVAVPALAADYQPRETFAPREMGQAVNAYRSGNGAPGPDYWQNRADYRIQALPSASSLPGLIEQHRLILAAIDRRDPDGAEAALRAHLSEILRALPTVQRDHRDLFA